MSTAEQIVRRTEKNEDVPDRMLQRGMLALQAFLVDELWKALEEEVHKTLFLGHDGGGPEVPPKGIATPGA